MERNSRPVYSTQSGRIREQKPQAPAAPSSDGVVRVRRERKGRGGKTVTVVQGVPLDETGLKALAQQLKQRCGSGGTLKDGVIEIQGDHLELLLGLLGEAGFKVKAAGG
ncbi:MAG TPA: stress response translation initiation inhibitor YciH [Pseudomonadales bacterium]|jgi:translation initiation factor 1|nr:stress response translation initiation inhibitor YciH [Pseudomonadales bacterium]HMW15380.1 stress response translation initiation inhibitor YciH [Pseudomonadales bacterium]HMW83584.1 stress response translation initiation inhibitor YciH [Pseudomonadales bacterium]HMZ71072.1 stress response translation initiation inhibitor YciH [Pseudomonadales bacterium]HMZ91986.1 stress response translation initiation inhibitor YciH [Pseudomonadales bacterium]